VSQLTLFDAPDGVLADDDRGRITYTRDFVDADTAAAWFAELREAVAWRAIRRQMYDREVDVPRLIASYRLDVEPIPTAILDAAARVTTIVGAPFNAVGLNRYRDGRDSVAPHNDHLYELKAGYPIALLSLGATRRMTIRAKSVGTAPSTGVQAVGPAPGRVLQVDLEPGSLLVMDYATQQHYDHGVPKTAAPVGERISLAFRVKPERRG
jgi:alkylated DNA repair dioxygenase AlkB